MNNLLIFIKAIILVSINRRLEDPFNNDDIIRRCLKDLKVANASMGLGSEGEIGLGLRDTLDWISTLDKSVVITKKDLLTRVRMNVHNETHYVEVLANALPEDSEEVSQEELRTRARMIRFEINSEFAKGNLRNTIRDANRRLSGSDEYLDQSEYLDELIVKLSELKSQVKEKGSVAEVEFELGNLESLEEIFVSAKEQWSEAGVLKTGYIGLNRMMGVGGFLRGFFCNFGALTHNYKTGILLDMFMQIPRFNTPYMFDPSKKALLLRISFENRPQQDLPDIYKKLVEMETGQKVVKKDIDPREAARYIKEKFESKGYHIAWRYYSPNDFTVDHLIAVLEEYEQKGYEIHCLNLDYLELICKSKSGKREDLMITDSVERLRGYCYPRGITVLNAHQLSTEAQNIAREGGTNFVSRVAQGGWYMNCKSLHTKLDLEILMHIVKTADASYLTFARGKMRGEVDVPMKHRVFAYKFEEVGGIHEDYPSGECKAIYDLNSLNKPIAEADDDGW